MKKPFKFRYVNEIVGAFVLLVVFLLLAGIIITGRAQGWFDPVYELRAEFGDEGSMGLRRGSEVRVLDTPVGMVASIEPREDGVMVGVFRVRGPFFQFIREDSIGIVRKTLAGIAGDSYVEITRGTGAPLAEEEPYIPIIQDTELIDLAESLLDEVRQTTVPAIEQLQALLEEATGLVQDLRDPEGEMQLILRALTQAMEEVNTILAHVAEATEPLPQMVNRVAGELEDVPGLVYQAQATLQETEILIEGIQRHWLIRRHVEKEPRPGDDRLGPSTIIGAGGAQ